MVLSRPSLYVSSLLLALRSMLQMDLPHLNVLTKIDNLPNYGDLPFNLDFYTEVQDLHYLLPHLEREQNSGIPGPAAVAPGGTNAMALDGEEGDNEQPQSKYAALNKAIVELVQDFALVGFETLAVEDKKSMMVLLRAIDRAGGYAFGGVEGANDTVWQLAMRQDAVTMDARDVQERWLDRRDELDEEERRAWAAETQERRDPSSGSAVPSRPSNAPRGAGGSNEADGEDTDEGEIEAMGNFLRDKQGSGVKVVRK
jgi:GPN-loop GTPase